MKRIRSFFERLSGHRTALESSEQETAQISGSTTRETDEPEPGLCAPGAKMPKPPECAIKLGYHGANDEGRDVIASGRITPSSTMRTGMHLPSRAPVFYITDRWEAALSYAKSPQHVFEIYCTDPASLTTDAFRRNAQGVNELKIRGGFDSLVATPCGERHLPTSFHKLGFDQPRTAVPAPVTCQARPDFLSPRGSQVREAAGAEERSRSSGRDDLER